MTYPELRLALIILGFGDVERISTIKVHKRNKSQGEDWVLLDYPGNDKYTFMPAESSNDKAFETTDPAKILEEITRVTR